MNASPCVDAALSAATTNPPPSPTWVKPGTAEYLRVSIALFLAGFSTFSLLYCVQPLFPDFTREFNVGPAESSLALSLSTGLLAVSILVAGAFSERLGRRGLMFASMTLAAVFNVVTALSPDWHLLLVARALEGLVLGGVPAVAMAYLAEEIDPRGLGLSMGLYIGGTAFGGMVGRVGMSVLSEYVTWRTAMATIGGVGLLAAVLFVTLLPTSRNFVKRHDLDLHYHLGRWRAHLANPNLPALFAVGCLVMGLFVTIYNYAGFRLMAPPFDLGPAQTGLIFSAYVFGILASSGAGALADRYGRGPILVTGLLVTGLGLALTLSQELAWVVAGIVALTIGFFMSHSVASGWVGRLANGSKGHASSLYLLAYYLGSSVLGSVGGWFWEHDGWPWVVGFAFALLTMCLALAARVWRTAP